MISTVEKVLFLKSVELFSRIPGEDLAQIAGIAQEVNFEQGELVIQEGEIGDSMFLIVEGEVMVHRLTQELTRLGEKESFGEMALLDNEPRSATVTAVSDATCLKIDRDEFYELMSEKIEIGHGIIRMLTQRLREANEKLSDKSGEPVA
jgi:CRP/FNR family cyclic AMP-dependent transcriptional regulator